MKLYIENEGENFEMEAKAAVITMIGPADTDADVALAVIGNTSPLKLIEGIAKTLDGFFDSVAKGNKELKKLLWKEFKSEFKHAPASTSHTLREEIRPVGKEIFAGKMEDFLDGGLLKGGHHDHTGNVVRDERLPGQSVQSGSNSRSQSEHDLQMAQESGSYPLGEDEAAHPVQRP